MKFIQNIFYVQQFTLSWYNLQVPTPSSYVFDVTVCIFLHCESNNKLFYYTYFNVLFFNLSSNVKSDLPITIATLE